MTAPAPHDAAPHGGTPPAGTPPAATPPGRGPLPEHALLADAHQRLAQADWRGAAQTLLRAADQAQAAGRPRDAARARQLAASVARIGQDSATALASAQALADTPLPQGLDAADTTSGHLHHPQHLPHQRLAFAAAAERAQTLDADGQPQAAAHQWQQALDAAQAQHLPPSWQAAVWRSLAASRWQVALADNTVAEDPSSTSPSSSPRASARHDTGAGTGTGTCTGISAQSDADTPGPQPWLNAALSAWDQARTLHANAGDATGAAWVQLEAAQALLQGAAPLPWPTPAPGTLAAQALAQASAWCDAAAATAQALADDPALQARALLLQAQLAQRHTPPERAPQALPLATQARALALQAVQPLDYYAASALLAQLHDGAGDRLATYRTLATAWATLTDVLGRDGAAAWVRPLLQAFQAAWGEAAFAQVKAAHDGAARQGRA